MTENEAIKWQEAFKKTYKGFPKESSEACDMAISALEEIQQYRALGTVEELREAMEKQRAKKPKLYGDFEDGKLLCPNCEEDLMDLMDCGFNNCPYCGGAVDFSEVEE